MKAGLSQNLHFIGISLHLQKPSPEPIKRLRWCNNVHQH
jgi:hypothetical protein